MSALATRPQRPKYRATEPTPLYAVAAFTGEHGTVWHTVIANDPRQRTVCGLTPRLGVWPTYAATLPRRDELCPACFAGSEVPR
jgi:hypothetical protein